MSALDDLDWTIWILHSGVPLFATVEGPAAIEGPEPRAWGTLIKVTGRGSVHLRFTTSAVGCGTDPFAIGPHANLTGRNGSSSMDGFHVWRSSTDPAAGMNLSGGLASTVLNIDTRYDCGGHCHHGGLGEGWTVLPLAVGDCGGLLPSLPGAIPAVLLIPGPVRATYEIRHRRKGPS